MKLEQIRPFIGSYVCIQFLEHWHAIRYSGQSQGDKHIAIEALQDTGSGSMLQAQPITTRVLGPVVLAEVVRGVPGEPEIRSLVIRTPGPDGSEIEIACDPENIAFVSRVVRPPAAESPIVKP